MTNTKREGIWYHVTISKQFCLKILKYFSDFGVGVWHRWQILDVKFAQVFMYCKGIVKSF